MTDARRLPFVRRSPGRAAPVWCATAAAVALSALLTGCVGGGPPPTPSASGTPSPSASTTATPSPSPDAVALHPGGTAQQNLPFFNKVNKATLAAKPSAQGRDFIDALVAAGFTKADMQVTPDTTTIGLKANSIQFSVRMGDSCLIGQNGADAGGYNSQVTPVLATGSCLIGQTRAIDW